MPEDSVKVAVRVRPFNQRELDRKATSIIDMQGPTTVIRNPDAPSEEPKKFSFDYSYWSHDGFRTAPDGSLEPEGGSTYASQRIVFNDLGQGVLNNAFEGYNCSLFAYGQTGSGKSYSMVGYGINRGIVPITCDELFKAINENNDSNKRFAVTFSMLEIYNEQVRDLLCKDNPKGGLQVRQNPKLGLFYVQDLKKVPVGSYKEIEKRMEQGTASRTVASTNMNATSSRAHTVVTIVFDQFTKGTAGENKKSSTMNLVDLAGSERADSTGATGDRLKEGANINKSLSALGNVISALADLSMGKKKVLVPYRDSVLTKLLQNALGGNSKTVMIAALSPADINYDETLGTLRYADRAKKIKNRAVVNENPMDKLIRELREENERLKKMMQAGGALPSEETHGMTPEEIEKMRAHMMDEVREQLMANQDMLKDESESSWEEQLKMARAETIIHDTEKDKQQRSPHLMNLNEDPMLSGVLFHTITAGSFMIGRKDGNPVPQLCLNGLSIMTNHAILTTTDGEIEIKPAVQGAKTKVNGQPLMGSRILEDKDRVLFGSNHLYVFKHPLRPSTDDLPAEISWEFAQKEIAEVKGFSTGGQEMSKEQQIAQEQVLELLPMVSEVNAISEELNKHRTFEVVLISCSAQDIPFQKRDKGTKWSDPAGPPRVMVKMRNLLNGNTWMWERGKFMNRRYLMQDMYQKWLDGEGDVDNIAEEEDPFWEPTEDVLIGTGAIFLQSLAYALDFDDDLTISDYKGTEEGSLKVKIIPFDNGKPRNEDDFIDDPSELLGKPYQFQIKVMSGEINKVRFSKGVRVKYRVYKDESYIETALMKDTLEPKFNHSQLITFNKVTQDELAFFDTGCITFMVYGIQEDSTTNAKLSKMTTRELRQMEQIQPQNERRRQSVFHIMEIPGPDSEVSHLKSELTLIQRKHERLVQKEKRLQELCRDWNQKEESEKQFEPFYRAVSAVANSSGTKLKTRVQILNKLLSMQRGSQLQLDIGSGKTATSKQSNGAPAAKGRVNELKPGGDKVQREGSKACAIQ